MRDYHCILTARYHSNNIVIKVPALAGAVAQRGGRQMGSLARAS